jgi:hypothetical protein
MLNITLYNNVLQVEQIIMSFTDTKREIFSYDFEKGLMWEGAYNAEQKHKRLLTEDKILWAAKYWLPKVNATIYTRKYRITTTDKSHRVYVLKCGAWSRIGLDEFEQIQINGIVFESHNIDKYKYFTEYLFYTKVND